MAESQPEADHIPATNVRVSASAPHAEHTTVSNPAPIQRRRPHDVTADDVDVARKMFIGGCFLLPWLWLCSAMYFYKKWRFGKDQGGSTLHAELCWYINRYLVGGSVYLLLLIIWNVIFQTSYKSMGMSSLLVNGPSSSGGWNDD